MTAPSFKPLRLRYRALLHEIVRDSVARKLTPSRDTLMPRIRGQVREGDEEAVADIAKGLLLTLHEGNAARYRIQRGDVEAWHAHLASDTTGASMPGPDRPSV